MRLTVTLHNAQQGYQAILALWPQCKAMLIAGHRLFVSVDDDEPRNTDQNAAQWPVLEAFSQQLKWPVNAEMVYMTADEWKDVLTAAFNNESVRLAQGLNGGVVMLGLRTSKFGKRRFSEWLDFLHATAALRGVDLSTGDDRAGTPTGLSKAASGA